MEAVAAAAAVEVARLACRRGEQQGHPPGARPAGRRAAAAVGVQEVAAAGLRLKRQTHGQG